MYVRLYQKTVRIPILREIFNYFSRYGNMFILNQDRRVVVTQEPKASELNIGEKLIQGDLSIILYRRRRDELKKEAIKTIS